MLRDATAAILAGGTGSRLGGTCKAFLEIDGRTVLSRQLEVLGPLFEEVVVVANDPRPFAPLGLRVVADRFRGKGAPAGVHAALEASRHSWVFCVACDMPLIRREAIELLAGRRADLDIVAPLRQGYPEPLFAFWSTRCLQLLEKALATGAPSLQSVVEQASALLVSEDELGRVDPGCRSLENVNTREDLARVTTSPAS
jgi:molybdenum cofactor guanylyltransferase